MSVERGKLKKLIFFDLPPSSDIFEKKPENIKHVTHKYAWICMYLFHFKK